MPSPGKTPSGKTHIDELGIFGGKPLFSPPRPIGQLATPPAAEFIGLIREAYERKRLTNDGPLVRQLEEQLAAHHGTAHCIALANAGLGLMMLLQITAGGKQGETLIPAFSYRGLPHFARWAGQRPRFCDVDPLNHTLSVASAAAALSDDTTAILAVCNFNGAGDIAGLSRLAAEKNRPLIIDSVYAIGSTRHGRPLGGNGLAEVFSLHATKLLNGFEGGYVTTNNDELAALLRQQRNFCFPSEPDINLEDFPHVMGLNAKLNEFHAAMALATLAQLDEIVARNRERYQAYRQVFAALPGLDLVPCPDSDEETGSFLMTVAEVTTEWPLSRDETVRLLRAEGCAINPYYSPPLHHAMPDPTGVPVSLPVAESLAERFFQLPAGDLVSLPDITRLGDLLAFVQGHGQTITARLRKQEAAKGATP